MALETFKAQLKAKAKTLGVTNLANKRIDAIAATLEKQNPNLSTDDDHAEKVDSYLELVDIKEIAAYDDYKATKKKEVKQEKKETTTESGETSADTSQKNTETEIPNDAPAWAKGLLGTVQTMAQTISGLQKEKAQSTISQKVASHEKIKGISAAFWNKRALPESEEGIDAFAEDVAKDYGTFVQESKDKGLSIITPPGGGSHAEKQSTAVDPAIKQFAEKTLAPQNGKTVTT